MFSGIGLHSGKAVTIKLLPAKVNDGIFFNLNGKIIKASWKFGKISQLCTQIKKQNIFLSTIEHLMSSLSGLSIDNLEIKTNSNEMPILDGSSKDFLEKIFECGLEEQNNFRKYLQVKKKIILEEKKKFIIIKPTQKKKLIIDYTIDYNNQFIGKQNLYYEHDNQNYKSIYKARTFCLHKDIEKIKKMGLAKGGSLENAIVVDDEKILNNSGLRNNKEFVNHKILDLAGDFLLSGYRVLGKVICYQGGHELTNLFLHKMFKEEKSFKVIELEDFFVSNKIKLKQTNKLAVNA